MTAKNNNRKNFRETLSQFATGVTVITTVDARNASPVGVTINSFNSVSMSPPLILWSLAKEAVSLPNFQKAEFFNVHILGHDQEDVSACFADYKHNKFDKIAFYSGMNNIPVLENCAAFLECRTRNQYDGGDHIIFVGHVLSHQHTAKDPLLFHQGRYTRVRP